MDKKDHISFYGRTQFEYVIVCLFIFLIFAVVTTSLVVGGGIGNIRNVPSVSGTGSLSETITMIGEPKDTILKVAKVSFSGKAVLDSNIPSGNWHIKFFDVKDDILDNSEFRAAEITSLSFSSLCGNSAHIEALGKLNNQLGWIAVLDVSENADSSTMRIRLYYPPQNLVYDTVSEFTNSGSCESQTLVDSGSLKVNSLTPP